MPICHSRVVLLRRPVKPTMSPRGLTTGSIKTTKNTNNFSIFNWIPWSSHGDDRGEVGPRNNAFPCRRESRKIVVYIGKNYILDKINI